MNSGSDDKNTSPDSSASGSDSSGSNSGGGFRPFTAVKNFFVGINNSMVGLVKKVNCWFKKCSAESEGDTGYSGEASPSPAESTPSETKTDSD